MLSDTVDLPLVAWQLQRMVERLVNRPTAGRWRQGLIVPDESRADPDWDLHLQDAVQPAVEVPPLGSRSERAERKHTRELAELHTAWARLWR